MIRVDVTRKQARQGENPIFSNDIDDFLLVNRCQTPYWAARSREKIRESALEIAVVSPYIITRMTLVMVTLVAF